MMDTQLLNHSMQVSSLAIDIALEMKLCPFYIAQIGIAALYHDIGKECIPKAILNKPGKLTNEEFKVMSAHTSIGNAFLQLNNIKAVSYGMEARRCDSLYRTELRKVV